MHKISLIFPWFTFVLVSCSTAPPIATISVSETKGLDRELEYISATVPLPTQNTNNAEILSATNMASGTSVAVQITDTLSEQGKKELRILFPVTIAANSSATYQVDFVEEKGAAPMRTMQLANDKLSLNNKHYKTLFSSEDDIRGGQVSGIILKNFDDQILKRDHIAMHWAPNFSKSDSEAYFNFEDLTSSAINNVSEGLYQILKERSGTTDSVPEIDVKGKYTFYDGMPYFGFESSMLMNAEVELNLIRNDEMTMDSLFTHVVYQTKAGKINHLELYSEALDTLDAAPIPHDANFVAFYHSERTYGFGSIRLEYDNSNIEGHPSPLHRPHTKISKSRGNGRYWNRVLSDTVQRFPKGSRYREKNAYLVFQANSAAPEKEILYYQERLQNPLTVTVALTE